MDTLTLLDKSIEAFLEAARTSLKGGSIFFTPDIPDRKLDGALGSYANGVSAESVLALVDETTLGSASDGMILTNEVLCAKAGHGAQYIKLSEIATIKYARGVLRINGKEWCTLAKLRERDVPELVFLLSRLLELESRQTSIPPEAMETLAYSLRSLITDPGFYFYPTVPLDKLKTAVDSYAGHMAAQGAMVLIDDSPKIGTADGMLLTRQELHGFAPEYGNQDIRLADIRTITWQEGKIDINGAPFCKLDTVTHEAAVSFLYALAETLQAEFSILEVEKKDGIITKIGKTLPSTEDIICLSPAFFVVLVSLVQNNVKLTPKQIIKYVAMLPLPIPIALGTGVLGMAIATLVNYILSSLKSNGEEALLKTAAASWKNNGIMHDEIKQSLDSSIFKNILDQKVKTYALKLLDNYYPAVVQEASE
jgi:hypothetical protein